MWHLSVDAESQQHCVHCLRAGTRSELLWYQVAWLSISFVLKDGLESCYDDFMTSLGSSAEPCSSRDNNPSDFVIIPAKPFRKTFLLVEIVVYFASLSTVYRLCVRLWCWSYDSDVKAVPLIYDVIKFSSLKYRMSYNIFLFFTSCTYVLRKRESMDYDSLGITFSFWRVKECAAHKFTQNIVHVVHNTFREFI